MNSLKFLIRPFKSITSKFTRQFNNNGIPNQESNKDNFGSSVNYLERLSKHRMFLPIYDLKPNILHAWIAPNSTLVGEVYISNYASIWYNVVLRGEINSVRIGHYSSVGDGTVIHTASSLPTGIPAACSVGRFVTIQSNCSLFSCVIEDECLIGARTVIMEGSWIEKGSVILPNSVVPPGRLIPSRQLWGGNPVEYIRDITESEYFANYAQTFVHWEVGQQHLNEFEPWPTNYLQKDSTKDDVDLNPEDLVFQVFRDHRYAGAVKQYP